jgi:hypothetical protein
MEFHLRYTPTIMDGPVLRWEGGFRRGTYRDIFSGESRTDWSGEISASRNGVIIAGDWAPLTSAEEVAAFAETMNKALAAHQRLASARDQHEVAKAIVVGESRP